MPMTVDAVFLHCSLCVRHMGPVTAPVYSLIAELLFDNESSEMQTGRSSFIAVSLST